MTSSDAYSDLPNGKRESEALDHALDDFVHGHRRRVRRLEPDLSSTIERMFALAEVSGMASAGPGTPRNRLGHRFGQWKKGIQMKQIVSISSTVAAVIILAIGINATVPGFRDQNLGLGTAVPTSDASDDGYQISTSPLTPEDCNVGARSRDEVIEILSIASDSGWYGESRGPAIIDDSTFREIDKVLRQWQACRDYGQTFQWLNLVSSDYLRTDVYGMRFPRPIYEPSTLQDIVDGWVTTDEPRQPEAEGSFGGRLLIKRNLDVPPTITGSTRVDITVDVVDTTDGEVTAQGYMVFVFEQERWRLSMVGIDSEIMLEIDSPKCVEEYCGDSPG